MAAVLHNAAQDFRRWELPEVGIDHPHRRATDPPAPQPTVRELEALHQQARAEGFPSGHAEGLAGE